MRVLVTGAGGFIGTHLVETLAGRGDVVEAWVRSGSQFCPELIAEVHSVDITNYDTVFSHLKKFKPELIFHLAAQSYPTLSWEHPALTYQINVCGILNLFEALRALSYSPRILVAGSSAEYADWGSCSPLTEETPTRPNSPYGASKLAASHLVELYYQNYRFDVLRFRPFFIAGPRKTGDVCSDFARRVIAIERGRENIFRVGSLDIVRDIMDIRDAISGILSIANVGGSGEIYNVCSGHGVQLSQIVETYQSLSKSIFKVTEDPILFRPLEQKVRIGCSRKLRALGWKQKFKLSDTLETILDYWRRIEQ